MIDWPNVLNRYVTQRAPGLCIEEAIEVASDSLINDADLMLQSAYRGPPSISHFRLYTRASSSEDFRVFGGALEGFYHVASGLDSAIAARNWNIGILSPECLESVAQHVVNSGESFRRDMTFAKELLESFGKYGVGDNAALTQYREFAKLLDIDLLGQNFVDRLVEDALNATIPDLHSDECAIVIGYIAGAQKAREYYLSRLEILV